MRIQSAFKRSRIIFLDATAGGGISRLFIMICRIVVFVVFLFALTEGGARAELRKGPLSTTWEVLTILKTCWIPPPRNAARVGMEITVRFSITRTGEILGKPKIVFETLTATDAERIAYRIAVMSMLQRCAPLLITDALGNAIAGRPLSIRLIDERQQRRADKIEWQETKARNPLREYL
jgi:hypothetical protein